ncbi:MAG: major capsid protein [Candidatus Omnitrophota bacterium]|jgi:hypothetical protein
MSAGGIFKLLASDGRADRMVHATDMLNERIRSIMCQRRERGMDPTPTLADIEKTHILFVNAHYRPFAAIAYEYTKVRTQSGNPTWGGHMQFSIPAYGEFFSDMVVHVTLGAVACTPSVVPAFPPAIGANVVTVATSQTSDVVNAAAHQYTLYTQEYVDAAGNVLTVGGAISNYTRYAEYPGERLFREVKFEITGNPLDTYESDATLFYRKFFITHDKEIGWKRLVGQEVPVDAYTNETAISGTNSFQVPMANAVDVTGTVVGPANATITARKLTQVVSGPQTPQAIQPALDLWIPLLFWFNKDVRLAIPSISIPYGQRFITIAIANQAEIVFPAPGNLFLRLTTEVRTDEEVAGTTGTAVALSVRNVSRQVNYEPILLAGSTVSPAQTMNAEMYVNNLFVNPEIHDIYIKRIGFTLVRVHRIQHPEVTASSEDRLLSQLKWPTEMIYIGMRPSFNTSAANPNQYRDWHNLTAVTDETMYTVARSSGAVQATTDLAAAPWPDSVKTFTHRETSEQLYVPVYTQTIDSLKVTVQGNDIITETDAPFFRDYTPWYYGQSIMRTPVDLGALLINFAIYPGTYQPSGHINISRAREFYVHYNSSYCSTGSPCQMITVGISINFLLVSDGSAVLRFTS